MINITQNQDNLTIKIPKSVMPYAIAALFLILILVAIAVLKSMKTEFLNAGLLIATVALACIAYIQLKALRQQAHASFLTLQSLKKQAHADFLLTLNREFFDNPINKDIIMAIEDGYSIFKYGRFTEYQIDDYLGYYELMAKLEKEGLLTFETIDDMFGHYIALAWKNEEIQVYIKKLREDTRDPRYYEPFESLAGRLIDKENEIRR